MTILTIRLDGDLTVRLRARAVRHGHSMEDEACAILRAALDAEPLSGKSLVDRIRARVEPFGGIELELPPREPQRDPPDLG